MSNRYPYPIGTLFTQTASVTVANTTTQTTLLDGGVGSVTLPVNFFYPGRTLRITLYGYHSTVANPNITMRVKFGSTTILTTGAVASGNSTNTAIKLEGFVTCRTDGATGTVIGQGTYTEAGGGANIFDMTNTATTTIDTTASQTVDITVQWGTASASNTITSTNVILEYLN